jgi:hypothetical protein
MPIATFAIKIACRHDASAAEFAGVAVTIEALVGGNLAARTAR